MNVRQIATLIVSCILSTAVVSLAFADPGPVSLLILPGSGTDPEKIDYDGLPRIEGTHAVVSPASIHPIGEDLQKFDLHNLQFQLHNYLVYHGDRFWCVWSHGPPIEDEPTQHVRYATGENGLTWSKPKSVTGRPDAPYAFIARGLWVRDGELLTLAAHFKGKGAFGVDKELTLRAYASDEESGRWHFKQKVYDNAINNFAPQQLTSGEWILTRRDARFNVSVLIGGRKSIADWQSFPVAGRRDVPGFSPDEPILWTLPGNTLFALYRDNGGSRRLFFSTSNDQGRTWTRPAITSFPNATSKLFSLQTSHGYRVLISNANPNIGRRELHLSISKDGRTFTRMALLAIPSPEPASGLSKIWHKFRTGVASLQYPHAIEHDEQLVIAFSRNKKQIELLRVPLDGVDALLED